MDILKGVFYPIPTRWTENAHLLLKNLPNQVSSPDIELRTGPKKSGRLPTGRFKSGTPTRPEKSDTPPTGPDSRGHLLKDDEDEEEDAAALVERVFAYFAERKGSSDYHPTVKEQVALEKLLADGFTYEQIVAGIDAAFARPSRPKHFTHCAAIARDLVRLQQESRMPETRIQPETREPEALEETDQQPAEAPATPVKVIETHLARAVEVYRSAGREITGDLLARFRLMASRCDQAARATGATGGDWLADALTGALGVARPGNLLNYADAVLSDWIANGRSEKPAKPAAAVKLASLNEKLATLTDAKEIEKAKKDIAATEKAKKKAEDDIAKYSGQTTSMVGLEKPYFLLKNPGLLSIPLGFLVVIVGSLLFRDKRSEEMWDELYVRQNTGINAEAASAH